MRRWLQPGLFALLIGCGGVTLPPPGDSDVRRIQSAFPGASLAELSEGRALYRGRCARCHRLYEPREYAADMWPARVADMRERADLTSQQERLIVQYLVAIADRPPEPNQ